MLLPDVRGEKGGGPPPSPSELPAMSYAGKGPAPLYAIPSNVRARRNTDRIMSGVSFFVFVFWRLGW